jgi:hypothetical protein
MFTVWKWWFGDNAQACVSRHADGSSVVHDVCLPPAVLEDTTAANLLAAINARARLCVSAAAGVPVVYVLNSDKAAALLKLGRHYSSLARVDPSFGFAHGIRVNVITPPTLEFRFLDPVMRPVSVFGHPSRSCCELCRLFGHSSNFLWQAIA